MSGLDLAKVVSSSGTYGWTESEWVLAAGGEQGERYPWDTSGAATRDPEQILQRTNISESGIQRTTPVGLYPQGRSYSYKLWDMAGNVFEWQANKYDKDHDSPRLRGGSWYYNRDSARVAYRDSLHPFVTHDNVGFRVASLPA